jgi:uncharacterized membrane protein
VAPGYDTDVFFGGAEFVLLAVLVLLLLGGTGVAVAGFTLGGFEREVERWRADGVVDAGAAAEIRTRYREAWAAERRRRMATALAVLGAVTVGVGAILFFAANWDELGRLERFTALVAAMTGCYAAGWELRYRRGRRHVGHAFVFLGTILFGVTLFLVDQMYHVEAVDSWTFFWWALAAIAVGVVVRSSPLAALAVATLMAFAGIELESRSDQFGSPVAGIGLAALYGLALYSAGTAFRPWLEPVGFSLPLRMTGYTLVLAAVGVLSFEYAYDVFGDGDRHPRDLALALLLLTALVSAVSAAALAVRRNRPTDVAQAALVVCLAGLVLLAVFVRPAVSVDAADGSHGIVWYAVVFSAVMALLAVGAIVAGFYADEVWLANAGVLFAVVAIVARFLDSAWSMLARSFVFLAAGALVLALAWTIERRRPTAP